MSATVQLTKNHYPLPVDADFSEESNILSKDTLDLLCFIYLLQEGGSVRRESLFRQGQETESWQELQRAMNNKLVNLSSDSVEMHSKTVENHTSGLNLNPFSFIFGSFAALFYTGPRKQEMLKTAQDGFVNAWKAFGEGLKEGKPFEVGLLTASLVTGGVAPIVLAFAFTCIVSPVMESVSSMHESASGEDFTDMTYTTTEDDKNRFQMDQMLNFQIMDQRQIIEGQITIYQQSSTISLTGFDTEGKAVTQITQIATNIMQDLITLVKKANLRTN